MRKLEDCFSYLIITMKEMKWKKFQEGEKSHQYNKSTFLYLSCRIIYLR